jgi:basic membrane protein A and related proteins
MRMRSATLWPAILVWGCLIALLGPLTAAGKVWRVALVLPGPISDQGFNAGAYAGLQLIQSKLNARTVYSEDTSTANYERVIRSFADDGNDIVILHGLEFADLARKIAPDYPKQFFVVTDATGLSGPNYVSIRGGSEEAAFLCGIVAGLTTRSNRVGAVIGFDFPLLVAQAEALRLGARSVNPKAELFVTYIGTFQDPAKAKEAALAQISNGVDILYHIADAAGIGVIQAAEERGVKAIGWGVDQNVLAPKTVVTSEVIHTADLMLMEVKSIMNGNFNPQPLIAGFRDRGVDLADYQGLGSPEVAAKVAAWHDALASGRLRIDFTSQRDGALHTPPVTLPEN